MEFSRFPHRTDSQIQGCLQYYEVYVLGVAAGDFWTCNERCESASSSECQGAARRLVVVVHLGNAHGFWKLRDRTDVRKHAVLVFSIVTSELSHRGANADTTKLLAQMF